MTAVVSAVIRNWRRPAIFPILIAASAACLPGTALAHASERMVILTLPTGYYLVGAALTVGLTALLAAATNRLPVLPSWVLFTRRPRLGRALTSSLSALVFLALLGAGFFGSHDPFGNLLPLAVWTAIWVGLTVLVAVFGDLWRDLNPWWGVARYLRRRIGWQGRIGLTRLDHWPAVAGFFAFAWYEIISLAPDDPQSLAAVALLYWLVILALAVAEGEDWLAKGEFLGVYFGFVARIAPFWAAKNRDGRLQVMIGLPGAQIGAMPPLSASAIAFVTLVLASVSFDGLSETFWWLDRIGINPLAFPGRSAVMGVNTAGLIGLWGASAATILGAIALGQVLTGAALRQIRPAIGPLMLSFLPIAAGYHIAHYLVALLTGGQYFIAALSDPLGRGWDLLGLGDYWVSFGFLTTAGAVRTIWNVQFAVILAAHVLAVILSQNIAARRLGALALRAHLPLTALMVLYTLLGLWLLSAPTAG